MLKFIKSFFSFGLATTIDKLIVFLMLPIYTRIFSPDDYGIIDLIQMSIGMVAIFGQIQLESSLQRYYYQFKGIIKAVFISTIFMTVVCLSTIVCVLMIVFSKEISILLFHTDSYTNLVSLAAFQLPFTNFSMLSLVVLRYEKRNLQFFLLVLLRVVLSLCLVLYLVVYQKMGLNGVFLSSLGSFFLASIPLFFVVKKFLCLRFSHRLLTKAFKYGLPQFPARIGSVLLTYANRIFMVGALSVASIGIYSLSLKLASSMQLVYSAFIMAWAPFMFKHLRQPKHRDIFPKALLLTAAPVFFLICAISLFSKEIVSLIASDEFLESYRYVGGLSLFYVLLIFKEIVDIGPKLKEKTKYLSLTFFCALSVNLLSLYIFIDLFGLKGVVFSMILTNTFLLAMSWIVSNKLYFIPFNIHLFIALAFPAYLMAIGVMFIIPPIAIRMALLLIVLFVYYFSFSKFFKDFGFKGLLLRPLFGGK